MNIKKVFFISLLLAMGASFLPAQTLYFVVTDLEGLEELQREFGAFRELLEVKTGFKIKFYPVTSRTAAVEAVRAKKADFVLTGPAEYVVMQTLTKCYPVIGFSRPIFCRSHGRGGCQAPGSHETHRFKSEGSLFFSDHS